MTNNECCGTCEWHCMQTRKINANPQVSSDVVVEWFCNNSRSEYYTDFTEYGDQCDEWENRRKAR